MNFYKNQQGSAALEFALVAPVFFAIVLGIIELSLTYLASISIEHGVQETARLIRTGQIQVSQNPQAEFRAQLCGNMPVLIQCDSRLYVDVRQATNFASVNLQPPQPDGNGNLSAPRDSNGNPIPPQFDPGGPSSIVVVRVYYNYPVLMPGMSDFLINTSSNDRLIMATSAFRNERYRT